MQTLRAHALVRRGCVVVDDLTLRQIGSDDRAARERRCATSTERRRERGVAPFSRATPVEQDEAHGARRDARARCANVRLRAQTFLQPVRALRAASARAAARRANALGARVV
jgi:hypothetical protein